MVGLLPIPKVERLDARITADQKEILRLAAKLKGTSLPEFIVASAQEAARRTIEDTQILQLSMRDRQLFFQAFLNPPQPSRE